MCVAFLVSSCGQNELNCTDKLAVNSVIDLYLFIQVKNLIETKGLHFFFWVGGNYKKLQIDKTHIHGGTLYIRVHLQSKR